MSFIITLLSIFFIQTSHAQIEFKTVSCSGIDEISCGRLKKDEAKRVNQENGRLFKEALKTCSPIKTKNYVSDKVVRVNSIEGRVADKCKLIMENTSLPARQICMLDKVALALMQKDPKNYTEEEKIQGRTLFKEQCKTEVVGNSKEADELRKINKSVSDSQSEMIKNYKVKMIENLNKEISNLKTSCNAGKKDSCAELEQIKKDMPTECKKPEMKEVCEQLKL